MLNFDLKTAQEKRVMDLHELEEIRLYAYENSKIYKEITKASHDKLIRLKHFKAGDSVLLFNSKLRLFPGKLRCKPYLGATHVEENIKTPLHDPTPS
ncbi:unnamed protein product [Microthlaspi erraticum]|uniref:Uncharacterized protein n=1 Tax=Microthlaspi erraticum TaxID=1685480 RepID=A0A6D2J3K4_9BRAS|nr:unnamed protein product [Microthlaspi erraticum]